MERSAIYRRALAPIVLALGALGLAAAVVGWFLNLQSARAFVGYWSGVGALAVSGAYLMARQQALKDAEAFWSAPTRRVTQALLPPLFVGFTINVAAGFFADGKSESIWWLVPAWMALYGCALHAAGFFMPRGMKVFGWGFILMGCGVAVWLSLARIFPSIRVAHLVMGSSFGGLHLAYGGYLYFTERRKSDV